MSKPVIAKNETNRVQQLKLLKILEAANSVELDNITRLTAHFFKVPMALVALVDNQQVVFKSNYGLKSSDVARELSIHSFATNQNEPFIIRDLRVDVRFYDNELIQKSPQTVFYMGQTILSKKGLPLGTLAIIDSVPRDLATEEIEDFNYFVKLIESFFHRLEEKASARHIKKKLASTQNEFEQTFEQAPVGLAYISLEGRWLKVNPAMCQMLGYQESELLDKFYAEFTYPADRPVDRAIALDLLEGKIDSYNNKKRYLKKSGDVMWSSLSVSMAKDELGQPNYYISVVSDITVQVNAELELEKLRDHLEEEVKVRTADLNTALCKINLVLTKRMATKKLLRLQTEKLQSITDNLPALISSVDASLHFTFANKAYESWFNLDVRDIIGKHVRDIIGVEAFVAAHGYMNKALSGKMVSFENKIKAKNGEIYIQTKYIPISEKQGGGFNSLSFDITDQKILQHHYEFEATHDALTGLPNRRAFMAHLQNLIQDEKLSKNVALLFLDLDDFKNINDTHGHEIGDAVLIQFARVIAQTIPANGFTARLAGDEFVILLQQINDAKTDISKLCNSIIKELKKIKQTNGIKIELSTSIGANFEKNVYQQTASDLLTKADIAMYNAKLSNKGRFFISYG